MNSPDRFAELVDTGCDRLADMLSLKVGSRRRRHCPNGACVDAGKKATLSISQDGSEWFCQRCKVGGGPAQLLAWALSGTTTPARQDWTDLFDRGSALGACTGRAGARAPLPPRVVRAPSPPARPPSREVRQLWESCGSVVDEPGIQQWVRGTAEGCSRRPHIDLDRAEGLVRALPTSATTPAWASCKGQRWPDAGYRLVMPLFGPTGVMESLHALRTVRPDDDMPKSTNPARFQVKGLVLADALGRLLLQGDSYAVSVIRRCGVWIAEGIADLLSVTTSFSDADEDAPAVLGLTGSGSWSAQLAARVPDETPVVIATDAGDADGTGDTYALKVEKTLRDRCEVRRWQPAQAA